MEEKYCENCAHYVGFGKCTGGFAPLYGWCDPGGRGAQDCPRYLEKKEE